MDITDIHWVIVGGESGPHSRPMEEEWVWNIKLNCERNNVAFFFKQWGGVQKFRTGRLLKDKIYDEYPKTELFNPTTK
ncbi:Phage Gp37/Gp68 family protein OS=Lysinibacillus sphaericus OX=1421 GN=LS41612_10590 PE=4 SV=1 [Lysinibacillus sphaericus]